MYLDGFVLPLNPDKLADYTAMAEKFARKARTLGALGSVEAIGDDVPRGTTTDFYRSVLAQDNETVVFSFLMWPDKATRDDGWKTLMADPELGPGVPMPFDGKRMFWGGFKPIVDTTGL